MNLLRQVTLNRANRKADRSVSITFTTQLEESSEGFMEVDELLGQNGVLYFKASGELTSKEIEQITKVDIEVEGKTKSERLRNVLYRLWEQEGEGDFNSFYSSKMEKLIEQIKDRLL